MSYLDSKMTCAIKESPRVKLRARLQESGSILLETVIVIPLFMLLIGGIMWSGQLIYDKQTLVIADRYAAWNAGNWHGATWNDVQQFFPDSQHNTASAPVIQTVDPDPHWSHSERAYVELEVTMPDWTKGLLLADAIVNGRMQEVPSVLSQGTVTLYGRDLSPDGQQPGGHYVIMRSPDYSGTRNNSVNANDSVLNVNFREVMDEPWAPFATQ
jgi:hypothetical protein